MKENTPSAWVQSEPWPDPTPEMLADPRFEAIWFCIRNWDIAVPGAYQGYTGAEGNHVRAILEALEIVPLLEYRESSIGICLTSGGHLLDHTTKQCLHCGHSPGNPSCSCKECTV